MKKVFFPLLCATMLLTASAQQRKVSPNDTLRSIVTNSDGSTTFSIYAPKAEKVTLGGDLGYDQDVTYKKEENGVWRATVHHLRTNAYRYYFWVDGMRVIDPRYPYYWEITPVANITNGEDIFWAQKDVPHGPVAQISYKSTTTGTTRSMHVWMPAGESAKKALPVMYLIHGSGDNDGSWSTVGCAGNILDNLYADGKLEPMIVVMPHGGIDVYKFVDELTNDIMPRVAGQYRVKTGPANTAIAGLSRGGYETLNCFMAHPDMFGYINVMSGGWFGNTDEQYQAKTEQLRQIAPTLRKTVRLLRFTMGGKEDSAYRTGQKTLKCFDDAGLKYEYSDIPGGRHTWYVWHYDLRDFAQRIFKK